MSIRRFMTLTRNLPMTGAIGEAHGYIKAKNWGVQEELMANMIEAVCENTRIFVIAHQPKGAIAPKPIRIPRPYASERKKRNATSSELKRMFGGVTYVPRTTGENER